MKKLFVALNIPVSIRKELTAVQPRPGSGIRLVNPDQMHVTLYFIGDAELAPIRTALDSVIGRTFSLAIQGLGQFRTSNSKTVLWAAIKESSQLNELHETIASILHDQGVQKETKPYTPHVTLARCNSGTATDVIDKFLAQYSDTGLPEFQITKFGLYTSTVVNNFLVYTLEKSYRLNKTQHIDPVQR